MLSKSAIALAATFVLTLTAVRSEAQGGPAAAPPQPTALATVNVSTRFVPLVKGEFVTTPRGGGFVRQVSKPVTCTIDTTGLGPGAVVQHYHWSGLDFGDPAPDAPSVTGVAHDPGAPVVSCTIDVVSSPGSPVQTLGPFRSKTMYVVGGPLSLGVNNGIANTPSRDPAMPSAPGQPANKPGPWYVEYFGFDPAGTKPTGAQSPQNGTVSAYGSQPGTTTYEWTVPGPLKRIDTGAASSSLIGVGATAGSAGSPTKVNLKYKFDNLDPDPKERVTGSCMDDSDQTPDPEGAVDDGLYRFDAHKPEMLFLIDPGVNNPTRPNGQYHNDRSFTYQLFDDGQAVMGWVYIVERFNTAQARNDAISLWPLSANGYIVDTFHIDTPAAHPTDYWVFNHYYYAATTDTGIRTATQSGILVLQTYSRVGTQFISNDGQSTAP